MDMLCRTTQPSRAHTKQDGISLIEVLVTLTILGLLMISVMPSIGNWMRNIEIRNAAETIQNGLTKARAEAVKRNEIVSFSLVSVNPQRVIDGSCTLSTTSGSWVISLLDPTGKCDVDLSDDRRGPLDPYIAARQSLGEGSPNVSVSVMKPVDADHPCGAEDNATNIAFNGYGRVAPTPWGTGPLQCIVVSNTTGTGTRKLNIAIGSGGTVRMCDPLVTSSDDPRKC